MAILHRRTFLQTAGMAAAQTFTGKISQLADPFLDRGQKPVAANDHINIALIGAGGQGSGDTSTAITVPGVNLVAVADCYDGRLAHAKERWGDDIFTTRDYKEILARKDIDAVIIGTPDHWHMPVAVDAMNAGKDVYCEKPMIHLYTDGHKMIDTAAKTNRILQIGSQRVSNILYVKAKELLAAGAIGELNMVQAHWDRNSVMGAWSYTVPLDASTQTCDWPRFLGTAPKIPFNPEHFFQWRKWNAYGSGVAGDLFVHLFSGTHFITGSNGPTRAMATGGIRFWKDGRDAYDVLQALFSYPEGFDLSLRVNLACGGPENEGFIFNGSEGTMEISGAGLTLIHQGRPKDPGLSIGTFTNQMQQQLKDEYETKFPPPRPTSATLRTMERFTAPAGYSDSYDHFHNFFDCIRTRKQPVEDSTFGLRAAGAALLSNESVKRGSVVNWNPKTMVIEKA